MSLYEITLGKEDMKFSSAHFTIFDSSAERLHGHNYKLRVTVKARRLRAGLLLDFGLLKIEARRLCGEIDEALLLPGESADVALRPEGSEIEIRCRGKRYVLPAEDCRVLPIANVSCECLAAWFCRTLVERLAPQLREAGVVSLAATIEESPGQSGRCEVALGAVADPE
jgi:6-pyruvoyltetrahydropterin/6-carboxytetrahydropterin synthase